MRPDHQKRWHIVRLRPVKAGRDGRRPHIRRDVWHFFFRKEAEELVLRLRRRGRSSCVALLDLWAREEDKIWGDLSVAQQFRVESGLDPFENLFRRRT